MTQLLNVEDAKRDEVLMECADRRCPVVLSHRLDSGWATYKSRILAVDSAGKYLILEQPMPETGQAPPELAIGEKIGVSFRRGHKKCMCCVEVAKIIQFDLEDGVVVPAFEVPWPEKLQEMQRRMYFRAAVPAGRRIEVCLWEGGAMDRAADDLKATPHHSGMLQDISAGGCRVLVDAVRDPCLQEGDTVGLQFQPDPRSEPLLLDAMFRHSEPMSSSRISLGFQFVGLETTLEGRRMLQALSRVVSAFLRIDIRRNNMHLNQHHNRR